MGAITFRPLTRDDFPMLGRWLAEPHVARWWNHETTPDAVARDFSPSMDGEEPNEDHVVLLDHRPIGLVQYCGYDDYPDHRDELSDVVTVPEGAVSIDYLIGDPGLTGRGIGTAMIRAFTERVWRTNPTASCVIVPVCSANVASWKALLAAGFHLAARGVLEPDNPVDDGWHEVLRLDRP